MIRNLLKRNEGQSLAETALSLPVLLLLLTAVIDFGLLFNNYLVVSNASREGARCASIGYTDMQIRNTVRNVASTLDETKLNIIIEPNDTVGRTSGDAVTVTVQYRYSMMTPIIAAAFPEPIDLKTSTTMRCE